MISALLALLTGVVGWLVSHLPASPFANLAIGDIAGVNVGTIMGWVNWLIPFQDLLLMFTAWVAACFAYSVAIWLYKRTLSQVSVVKEVTSLG